MKTDTGKAWIMILLSLLLTSFPLPAIAAEEPAPAAEARPAAEATTPTVDRITGEVTVAVLSAYIWRGQEMTRDSVVIEPSLTANYKGFTATLWGNLDTNPYSAGVAKHSSNWTETDFILSYAREFGIVKAGAGYIYYGLAGMTPNGADLPDAQEFFVTLGLNTLLAPTLTVYREIDHYHQWYATLGVSHTFSLHERVGLKLTATASYLKSEDETTYPKFNSDSIATTDKFNNFHDGVVSVSLPVAVAGNLTITPTASYVFPLSDDARYEIRARGLKGTANPLDELGKRIARRFRLICFDEFHIADVTDAMILHRLLEAMFAQRVSIVTTSNFHPDGLYPNGLHRERILPAIELLKQHMQILDVDAGTDYRQRTLDHVKVYHTPLGPAADAAMLAAFDELAEVRGEAPTLHIEQRELHARRRAGGVVWFDFSQLCGGPRSQNDYLELASRFHTVLLSDVPAMSPRLAREARRFTWLVDVLYDRRVKLILSAAVEPELLYTEGPLCHEFPRTASRLQEMQTAAYLALTRRAVDTALT